jgi:hypothetical protein
MFLWKYFFSTKWERSKKIKRELVYIRGGPDILMGELVYIRGGSHTHGFS